MKASRVVMLLGLGAVLLGFIPEADAATARVRCRVRDARLRIMVDGQNLAPGTYTATVVNLETGDSAESKPQIATPAVPDVDFDFDSTAQPDDKDTFIPRNFAHRGDVIEATINPGAVAQDTGRCRAR